MARKHDKGKHAAHASSDSRDASRESASLSDESRVPDTRYRYGSRSNTPQIDGYSRKVRSSRKRDPWRVVLVVSVIVLVGALVALGAIAFQYIAQQRAYDDLGRYANVHDGENLALSDLTVDWAGLQAVNPDVVGWIYVPDTPIDYPIVQGEDNEEYLHKAFDGSTGWLASAGTIFLDAGNADGFSDRNNALYGHHMNDGSMFAALSDWMSDEEFNAHRDIYVLTPAGNYRLKSFALVKTTGSDALVQTVFSDDGAYRAYIQDKLDRSVVNQTGEVLSADSIEQSMLLSTCEYSQSDGRAVLFCAVMETTVDDDAYVPSSVEGTTGLPSGGNAELGL